MKLLNLRISRQIREFNRARHIAEILIRNGLGAILGQLELSRFLPQGWRRRAEKVEEELSRVSLPERVRHTLEDLGPTYIKIGQILSGRGDLLPPEYIQEFTKLLDSAEPFPYEDVARQIEAELGAPPDQVFASFDHTPIAAASIGQVHRAVLHSGERVVVKVQRPDIEEMVRSDLGLLSRQAAFLERRSAVARNYSLSQNIEELGYALTNELDYKTEAQNIARFYATYNDDPALRIPRVHWEYSTRRVIVMEEIDGVPLSDRERLRAEGYDLPAIAQVICNFYLQQIFEDGLFHADPHPANLLAAGDQVAVLDFGMIGVLSTRLREDLGDIFVAVITQNTEQLITVAVRMGLVTRATNLRELERDINRMLVRYLGRELQQIPIDEVLSEILTILFTHKVRLPGDVSMFIRALMVLEGLGRGLDPNYQIVEALEPYIRRLVADKMSIKRLGMGAVRTISSLSTLAQRLPNRLDDLWDQIDEGNLSIGVSVRELTFIMGKVDKIVNRLVFALIVVGLIIGSSLVLMIGDAVSTLFTIPFTNISLPIAQIGFVFAGLAGAWLLWSVIRSKGL